MAYRVLVVNQDGDVVKSEIFADQDKAIAHAMQHITHGRTVKIQQRIGDKRYHRWEYVYDWQYHLSPVAVVVTPRYNKRNYWARDLFNNRDDAYAAAAAIMTYLDEHPALMAAVHVLC